MGRRYCATASRPPERGSSARPFQAAVVDCPVSTEVHSSGSRTGRADYGQDISQLDMKRRKKESDSVEAGKHSFIMSSASQPVRPVINMSAFLERACCAHEVYNKIKAVYRAKGR